MRVISRKAEQNLTTGALSVDFDFDNPGRLLTIYMAVSSAIIEDITISHVSAHGDEYNVIIAEHTFDGEETCYIYAAEGHIGFNEGDKLRVECSNANSQGVARVTAKMETHY